MSLLDFELKYLGVCSLLGPLPYELECDILGTQLPLCR